MRTGKRIRSSTSSRGLPRTGSTYGEFLQKHEYINDAPTEVGEQVRINHTNCKQGTDTRRRLYIKKISPGTVVAFCHNCGCKGSARTAVPLIRSKLVTKVGDNSLPKDYTLELPLYWKAFLYGMRFDDSLIAQNKIGYSPSLERLIIPIYEGETYVGWAGRSNTMKPKWVYPKSVDKARYLILK